MELSGKKYEILPGTAVPNMKDILAAASDFSTPGVENLQVKGDHSSGKSFSLDDVINDLHTMNEEDLKKLQALGDEVSESEAKAQEESRRKMEAIMNSAVIAPESLSQLRERAANEVSDEKKAEIEKMRQEQEAKEAEEQAKAKAREERRQMQRQAILDSRAKAEEAASIQESTDDEVIETSDDATVVEDPNNEVIAVTNTTIEEASEVAAAESIDNPDSPVENTVEESVVKVETESVSNTNADTSDDSSNSGDASDILSADDTLDDFSEFL